MTARPFTEDDLAAQMRDPVWRAAYLRESLQIALGPIGRAMRKITAGDEVTAIEMLADGDREIRKTLVLVAKAEAKRP